MKTLLIMSYVLASFVFSAHADKLVETENAPDVAAAQVSQPPNRNELRTQGAPVWAKFKKNFDACVTKLNLGQCKPQKYFTYANFSNGSCMNSGHALNIFEVNCNGVTHKAIEGGKFAQILTCLKGMERETNTKTIFRNGQYPFNELAFFSIGCPTTGGRRW